MGISSILGVIVLYETDFANSKTFKTINNSLSFQDEKLEILLYDNSLKPQYKKQYFELENLKVHYIHDSSNNGIGTAYNAGSKLAQKISKNWLLLLDQDTVFPKNIFKAFLQASTKYPTINLFSPILKLGNGTIFSPCTYIFKRGFAKKKVYSGIISLNYNSPVNSGMFVNLEAFLNVGGYNEKIKLDFSDFQFIERFKKENSHFYLMNEICIQDFSNEVNDIEKLKVRYNIYCNDALNCQRNSPIDSFWYFFNALLRGAKLSLRTKSIIFLKTWTGYFTKIS